MDAQSALWSVAGLAALVHGLAIAESASAPASWPDRAPLMESSFRAARDGLAATLHHDGALRPVPEIARSAISIARAHLDDPAPLEGAERLLREGGGADRQRAAFAAGGMPAMLRLLADETAGGPRGRCRPASPSAPSRRSTSHRGPGRAGTRARRCRSAPSGSRGSRSRG